MLLLSIPIMNVVIRNLQKAELFASIFQHIKLFTEHITIHFEKHRLYIQTMDSSRVSIIEITIPNDWFDIYEHTATSSIPIGLHAQNLYKILSTREKAQEINISFSEDTSDKLYIHFTCGQQNTIVDVADDASGQSIVTPSNKRPMLFDKHFEMPLMDIEFEMMNVPEMECQAEFSILSGTFANLVNQLRLFGDTLEIECSEEEILLHSLSVETGKMTVKMDIDDLTEFAIDEGDTLQMSFSLIHLHNVCMYNKLSKEILVKLIRNYPLNILFDLGDGASLAFYLAPKITDNE